MKGRVELVEFPISETSPIVGLSLAEINKKYEFQILVCAIKRGEQVYIPDGNFVIEEGRPYACGRITSESEIVLPVHLDIRKRK